VPGKSIAVDVLAASMAMIQALDHLDATLLSSVDTSLEPVSILNDVRHSSLKMLLARALRNVSDDAIQNLDWKKWVGNLLVKGKYMLLGKIDADAPEIQSVLDTLEPQYKAAPTQLMGYKPPSVADVMEALDGVSNARAQLAGQKVTIQMELGDIELTEIVGADKNEAAPVVAEKVVNNGVEFFKIKSPDMLGTAQWTVLRNNKITRVTMLHQQWLDAYHRREHVLLPGDSLKCRFEDEIFYDASGNQIERKTSIIEVIEIISPPKFEQTALI
jgi:hypothetical protein